jgi:hypothetical protein
MTPAIRRFGKELRAFITGGLWAAGVFKKKK